MCTHPVMLYDSHGTWRLVLVPFVILLTLPPPSMQRMIEVLHMLRLELKGWLVDALSWILLPVTNERFSKGVGCVFSYDIQLNAIPEQLSERPKSLAVNACGGAIWDTCNSATEDRMRMTSIVCTKTTETFISIPPIRKWIMYRRDISLVLERTVLILDESSSSKWFSFSS